MTFFDVVNHNILFEWLNRYDIHSTELNWFQSYLNDQKQTVAIRRTLSETEKIVFNVPQRTILEPILFFLYINELQYGLNLISILFANDTTLSISCNTIIRTLIKTARKGGFLKKKYLSKRKRSNRKAIAGVFKKSISESLQEMMQSNEIFNVKMIHKFALMKSGYEISNNIFTKSTGNCFDLEDSVSRRSLVIKLLRLRDTSTRIFPKF